MNHLTTKEIEEKIDEIDSALRNIDAERYPENWTYQTLIDAAREYEKVLRNELGRRWGCFQ